MKKLMTLTLGLALAFGAVSAVFGQEPTKKEDTTKKKGGKKGGKKKEDSKKEGGK